MASSHWVTQWIGCNPTNYNTGRGGYGVNGIVIHHACCTNIGSMDSVFQRANYGGSAHYGVQDWTVHQYVDENDTAWHCLPTDITEVMTPYGFVPLSQIEVGDAVYQWDKDTGEITVGNVEHVVEPRIETVFRMRDTEATAEHKIAFHTYKDPAIQVSKWGEKLNTQFYFPDEFYYNGEGIDLTDDQIRFLVAVQADGSYIRNQESISFGLRKERKIGRLINLVEKLGLSYHLYHQAATTRIIIDNVVSFCEQYLEEKQFSYKLLDMSKEQMDVFISELPYWDGHRSDKTTYYCSNDQQSVEMVQIIMALSGRQSNVTSRIQMGKNVSSRITLPKNNKYMFDKTTETTSRETTVSCISVPTGFIIIRQYGRVQIIGNCGNYWGNQNTIGIECVNSALGGDYPVSDETLEMTAQLVADIAKRYNLGKLYLNPSEDCPKLSGHRDWPMPTNCPGDYLYARLQAICDRANDINFPSTPTPEPSPEPEPPHIEWVDVPETTLKIKDGGTDLVDVTNGNVIKHIDGDFTFVQRTDDGKYVRTQYSKEKGINNGVLYSDLIQPQPEPTPEPEPEPTPDPGDDTPNWFIRFIHALGEFFIHLFTKKED